MTHVRDFTPPAGPVVVEVDPSSVHELLLSLFVLDTHGEEGEYEHAEQWRAFFNEHASPELAARAEDLRAGGELWLSLIATAHESRGSIDGFLAHIDAIDPLELRRLILTGCCLGRQDPHKEADVAAAVGGDLEALDRLGHREERQTRALRVLFGDSPEGTTTRLHGFLRAAYDEVFSKRPDVTPVLTRDAEHKRAMAARLSPEKVVEEATNGITFSPQAGVSKVVLVPSVILRPWVVILESGGTKFFCYPVADEHLAAEPGSPPPWIVDFYKALGDERRLRILSMLARRDAGLREITDELGLAKSTVHHHLRMLRAAGLVRVTIGEEKEYSLRREAVTQAGQLIEGFLPEPDALSPTESEGPDHA